MRVWDIPLKCLCRKHLLAEHHELHAIWSILTKKKKGYSRHPETRRWEGKLKALYLRHQDLVKEFKRRGYRHQTPLDRKFAIGARRQKSLIDSLPRQFQLLKNKKCPCPLK